MVLIKKINILIFATLIAFSTARFEILAKDKDKNKAKSDTTKVVAKPPKKKKSFDDSLKTYKKFEGLFKIYQDTSNGGLLMTIKKDQIDKEFIYFSYSENGLVNTGHYKGGFRDNKIFTIKKYFNKLEFIELNNNFYFDSANPISKAKNANISNGVLFSKKISDTDHDKGEYLINADDIFLTEYLHRVKPSLPRGVPADAFFSLGNLNKDKSKVLKIKSYPQNTDVLVEYVFENPYPNVGAGGEVADDRNVSIQIQHSLIEIPKNDFKPRFDDQRVGYFITAQNDMTSISATPFHDYIHKWHLEKKDKSQKLSEPIKPITWWIENTTPLQFRETIKAATLAWNEAFEMAGFKNAIVVETQPDTATWDAGDIRYNVLRWTSTPNPIFGGYGPSFVNPKTGEILGADIMLEWIFVTNRLKQADFYDKKGTEIQEAFNDLHTDGHCNIANHLQNQLMFGNMVMDSNRDSLIVDEFMKQAIYYLVLHEVGHTLGLNHNMKASQLYSPSQINNKYLTSATGIIASVMDYPATNICEDNSKQGYFFITKAGPYDKWAIEFGYKTFENEETEKKELEKILSRSTEPALAFGNDADDMRFAGMHLDPRIMINDLTNDAITFMSDRVKIADKVANSILKKYSKEGKSFQEIRNAYSVVMNEKTNAANIISRYVGGIYVERYNYGQKTSKKPYTPVSLSEQKRAFAAIDKLFLAPEAFKIDANLYQYLQIQRRGFSHFGYNEDPKIHESILAIQKNILDHWLHPNVLKRLIDTELYGNKYNVNVFLTDLTNSVFKADIATEANSFRRNLQIEYTQRLANAAKLSNPLYDHISKAAIILQLKNIQKMTVSSAGSLSMQAHKNYLNEIIKNAFEK